jgi:hypothetical protein
MPVSIIVVMIGARHGRVQLHSSLKEGIMEIDSEEQAAERAEIHFLAALVDELMKALLANGAMNRTQLQTVEDAVSRRLGTEPRNW